MNREIPQNIGLTANTIGVNLSGERFGNEWTIGCPIVHNSKSGPLHIWMSVENTEGYIQCEKLTLLDLSVRGYQKTGRLPLTEMMNVSDAIQGIFEYI